MSNMLSSFKPYYLIYPSCLLQILQVLYNKYKNLREDTVQPRLPKGMNLWRTGISRTVILKFICNNIIQVSMDELIKMEPKELGQLYLNA